MDTAELKTPGSGRDRPSDLLDRFYIPLYLLFQRFMRSQGDICDEARRFIEASPAGWVLDLACGPGLATPVLQDRLSVGVDISAPAVLAAKRSPPGKTFIRADVRHLPFRSGLFSAVLAVSDSAGDRVWLRSHSTEEGTVLR